MVHRVVMEKVAVAERDTWTTNGRYLSVDDSAPATSKADFTKIKN